MGTIDSIFDNALKGIGRHKEFISNLRSETGEKIFGYGSIRTPRQIQRIDTDELLLHLGNAETAISTLKDSMDDGRRYAETKDLEGTFGALSDAVHTINALSKAALGIPRPSGNKLYTLQGGEPKAIDSGSGQLGLSRTTAFYSLTDENMKQLFAEMGNIALVAEAFAKGCRATSTQAEKVAAQRSSFNLQTAR